MQKWLRAKLESPCAVCGETIIAGDRILPFVAAGQHRFRYMHLSCAKRTNQAQEEQPSETPVCKHWKSRGFCLYGDKCVFQHPPELAAAQQPARRAAKAAGVHAAARVGATKQRVKIKKRFRAGAFRRFLIDTFGREQLRSGAGVLDVAGGKGELAFELANLNGIPATVVEPRVLDLAKRAKWLKFGFYNWNSLFSAYNDRVWISRSVEESAAASAASASASASAAEAPAGASGLDRGGAASAAAALGATGSVVLPNHLRMVITTEVSQLLGLDPNSSPAWGLPGASKGSAGTDTQAGAGAGASLDADTAAAAVAPLQCDTAVEGVGSSSEGPAAAAAGSEGSDKGSSNALPMPPGWPAAFRRAQEEAQHSRWTHKGLEHESAAAAAAALGGDGWSSDEEDGDASEELAQDGEERAGGAGSQAQPPPAAAEVACAAGTAGSGNSSLPPEQLAQVGSFLDGLFGSMEAADTMPAADQQPQEAQQPPEQGQQGGAVAAPAPASSKAGAVAAGRAAVAAVGGSTDSTAAAPNSAAQQQQAAGASWEGEEEEGERGGASLPAEQLAQVGSFLDSLFSSMEAAGTMPAADQPPPQLPQQGQQGGAAVAVAASPTSNGAAIAEGPAAEAGRAAVTAGGASTYGEAAAAAAARDDNSSATAPHEAGGLGVAGVLQDLFARIEAGGAEAAAPMPPTQQHQVPPAPTQQPMQRSAPMQQPIQQHAEAAEAAEAAGSVPTAADVQASSAAGSQAAATVPGGLSFMEGLFARMDEQAWVVTSEQQAAAAELAGGGHATAAGAAAMPPPPQSPPTGKLAPVASAAGSAAMPPEHAAAAAGSTDWTGIGAGTGTEVPQHAASASAGWAAAGAGADVGEFLAALFERLDAGGAPEAQPHSGAPAGSPQLGTAPEEGPGAAGQEAAEAGGSPAAAAAAVAAAAEGDPSAGHSVKGGGEQPGEQAQQQALGGREVEEGGRGEQAQQQALGGQEVDDPLEAWQLLTRASVIVGMHPDQTTEFIVDLALRHGRPFAVVPCCVYPSQFPGRRLRGRPVRTYDQLVEYLMAKAPDRIRVAQLPFQGMNKVLYCL